MLVTLCLFLRVYLLAVLQLVDIVRFLSTEVVTGRLEFM